MSVSKGLAASIRVSVAVTLAAFSAGNFWCHAQQKWGSFVFQNYAPFYGIDAPVFDSNGNRLEGTNYLAMLYGASKDESTNALHALLPAQPFLTGTNAGYFISAMDYEVPGVIPGDPAWLQVRAWDRRLGESYELAAAGNIGGYGESQ